MTQEIPNFQELLILSNLDNEYIFDKKNLKERIIYLDNVSLSFYKALLFIKYKLESINIDIYGEQLSYCDLVYYYFGKTNHYYSFQKYYTNPLPTYKKVLEKYADMHVLSKYYDLCKLLNNIYIYYQAISSEQEVCMELEQLMTVKKLIKKYSK